MQDNRVTRCFTIIDCSRRLFDECVSELKAGDCSPEREKYLRQLALAQRDRIIRKREELRRLGVI